MTDHGWDLIQDGGYKRVVPRDTNPTMVPREALEDALEGLEHGAEYWWGVEVEYIDCAKRVLNE